MKTILRGAILAALLSCAPATAHAQQQCVWGTPQWEGWDLVNGAVTNHFSKVTVPCNGGILACQGRVLVLYWIYDFDEWAWVPYGTHPNAAYEPGPTLCGNSFTYTTYAADALFPSGAMIRQQLAFQKKVGSTWSVIGIANHDFVVP